MSDIKPEVIQKTQKLLGKHIKKPVLTEKLLKKPPFRFLHDVVTAVIKDTGFLKGLFLENDLNSTNFTDKDGKVAFLTKLIEAVKTITKTDLKVKASKVVAGLEPTETNLLLQTIAKAIDKKLDSSEYVKKLNGTSVQEPSVEKKKQVKTSDEKVAKVSKSRITKEEKVKPAVKKSSSSETPKSTDRSSTKESSRHKSKDVKVKSKEDVKVKSKEKRTKENKVKKPAEVVEPKEMVQLPASLSPRVVLAKNEEEVKSLQTASDKTEEKQDLTEKPSTDLDTAADMEKVKETVAENNRANLGSANLTRPKSARPKSGERDRISSSRQKPTPEVAKSTAEPLELNQSAVLAPPAALQRPKSSLLRPPSVRPSSARPAAPRLRPDSALPIQETVTMGNINVIIENVDNIDDEETVVVQNTSDLLEEDVASHVGDINIPQDNQGHLVEQILEQIQDGGVDEVRKKVDIDWENNGVNQSTTTKEVVQLRGLIQSLTKTANPLGKLLNYLHEDIEAMHGELQMWINVKKQLFMEIDKQKRMSAESDKPLLVHLDQLQKEIKKQEQEIVNVRSNILKNELKIKEIVSK